MVRRLCTLARRGLRFDLTFLVALIPLVRGGGHCRVWCGVDERRGIITAWAGLDTICYADTATESL